jgi:hypothetical protein
MTGRMTAPESGVKIRMYRQGLGDCFLLAFPGGDGEPRYLLIDCGVYQTTVGGPARMREVMADIAAATAGRLHVLVVTHEHWDHLSGFHQAAEIFQDIRVDDVWLAWTENLSDDEARYLGDRRREAAHALHAAATRLHGLDESAAENVEAVLGFFGPYAGIGFALSTDEALKSVKARGEPPRFLEPGAALSGLAEFPGVRFYVLGPPRERARLRRDRPRKREVYEAAISGAPLDAETAFNVAVRLGNEDPAQLSADERDLRERAFPFDRQHRISREQAKNYRFFRETYGLAESEGEDWRRIEGDWLHLAEDLALKLDSGTNNTSLVLAIELIASRKVLLFPGDAQAGSWDSWDELHWKVTDAECREHEVTAEDLLRRTVFYKVGHHGSHNATFRDRGLERMQSPELTVMIPVDRETAGKPKGSSREGWKMPFEPLLKRLKEKTGERVIQADVGVEATEPPEGVTAEEWQAFQQRLEETEDYLEYTVPE